MPEQVFIEKFHFNRVSESNPEPASRGIEYRQYLGTASIEYPNFDPSLLTLYKHKHICGHKNVNVYFPYWCQTIECQIDSWFSMMKYKHSFILLCFYRCCTHSLIELLLKYFSQREAFIDSQHSTAANIQAENSTGCTTCRKANL